MWRYVTVLAAVIAAAACSAEAPTVDSSVQLLRGGQGPDASYLGLDVLVTDSSGEALPCEGGELDVVVDVAVDGGAFATISGASVRVACAGDGLGEVAIVADNSGSESGYLSPLRQGVGRIVDGVVAAGGEASLVRVSTNASVLSPLTSDVDQLTAAADEMRVTNGWTSLYDGVRMANETLGGAVVPVGDVAQYPDLTSFCAASRQQGILLFTDGHENNSADDHAADYDVVRYPGDGLDTTLEDLREMRIDGITTPIYAVGLGNDVDDDALASLAADSGGRYLSIERPEQITEVFGLIAEYFGASHHVCAELPAPVCGDIDVRVSYTWTDGSALVRGSKTETIHLACGSPSPEGRSATVVLTMSNPGVDIDAADRLASNLVKWVSAVDSPKVLVVLDDNHHREFAGDAAFVASLLEGHGHDVTFANEPRAGLSAGDVAGFDVVWFSNPGYPVDDQLSIETLQLFGTAGGGVVYQGDDITWAWGKSFSMSSATHVRHVSNGTRTCGRTTNNNRGGSYIVTAEDVTHPVLEGLGAMSFTYGNDIDHSVALGEGEQVLATASFASGNCALTTPAVIVYDPNVAPSL